MDFRSWLPWSRTDSRLYIDKIFTTSSRYANWEPSRPIEPGDYGTIDQKTGEFQKDGNIFALESTKDYASTMLTVTQGATDRVQEYVSNEATSVGFQLGPEVNIAGLATAAVKSRFKFKKRRGAVLVMHGPQLKILEGDLQNLPTKDIRDKNLVTQVVKCPDYFMFLSQEKSGHLSLILQADVPVVAGLAAGGSIGNVWHRSGIHGSYKESKCGEVYTPLFQTKVVRKLKQRRGAGGPNTAEEGWVPSAPPWKTLDRDGEEYSTDNDNEGDSDSDSEDSEEDEGDGKETDED